MCNYELLLKLTASSQNRNLSFKYETAYNIKLIYCIIIEFCDYFLKSCFRFNNAKIKNDMLMSETICCCFLVRANQAGQG